METLLEQFGQLEKVSPLILFGMEYQNCERETYDGNIREFK
jgi:hypothetical protein